MILHTMKNHFKYLVIAMARGHGKTYFCCFYMILQALLNRGDYLYVAPYKDQAKKIVWPQFKSLLQYVPQVKFSQAEQTITFPNGSIIHIGGTVTGQEKVRGIHPKGAIIDEPADMPHDFWFKSLYPAMQIHDGWVIFIGTPKGRDVYYDLFQMGLDPRLTDWGAISIDVYQGQIYSPERIAKMKLEMTKAGWEQEYELSWAGTIDGSYYSEILKDMQERGKIGSFPYDRLKPVVVAIDPGKHDNTAIWFAQAGKDGQPIIIDFYQSPHPDFRDVPKLILDRGYTIADVIVPNDMKRTFTESSRLDNLKAYFRKITVLPKCVDEVEDISITQNKLFNCKFDLNKHTNEGINCLRMYVQAKDRITGVYLKFPKEKSPYNDAADAFRYLMIGWKAPNRDSDHPTPVKYGSYSPMQYGSRGLHGNRLQKSTKYVRQRRYDEI